MKPFLLSLALTLGLISEARSDVASLSTIPLWPQGAPEENGLTGEETPGGCIGNISTATLTIHLPAPEIATGIAVIIIPGGGYGVVCTDTEGRQIAEKLTSKGIAGIVLKYRLPNQHHKIPASDARRAIQTVRHNASKWKIDSTRVGVWGFSAGGHLASTVSTSFTPGVPDAKDLIRRQSSRPDFSILFYPVISMESGVTHQGLRNNLLGPNAPADLVLKYSNEKQVSKQTPPTFLLHAADDKVVSIKNTLRYYQALIEREIPALLVAFETGGHGPTAFQRNPSWARIFEDWIMNR